MNGFVYNIYGMLFSPVAVAMYGAFPNPGLDINSGCSTPPMLPVSKLMLSCFAVTLNANRHVTGVLRGFDQFMNCVLDNAVDEKMKTDIGMVVRAAIRSAFPSPMALSCGLAFLQ